MLVPVYDSDLTRTAIVSQPRGSWRAGGGGRGAGWVGIPRKTSFGGADLLPADGWLRQLIGSRRLSACSARAFQVWVGREARGRRRLSGSRPVALEKRRRRSVFRSLGHLAAPTATHRMTKTDPGERLERPSTAYPPISPPAQGSSYTVIFVLVDNHSSRDTDIFPSLLGAVTGTEHSCDSRRRHSTGLGHFQSRGIQVPISR